MSTTQVQDSKSETFVTDADKASETLANQGMAMIAKSLEVRQKAVEFALESKSQPVDAPALKTGLDDDLLAFFSAYNQSKAFNPTMLLLTVMIQQNRHLVKLLESITPKPTT